MTIVRGIRLTAIVLLAILAIATAWLAAAWQNRAHPADIPLPVAEVAEDTHGRVTVTWLGITTLLFDDGETQILTDATFSRFPLHRILLQRPLESDFAAINYGLHEYRIDRLAVIVPLHSHFDHAIDAGHVANRTGAMILGSESTANVARGSAVPVDQYQILQYGESRFFGDFTVTLLESRHVPQIGGRPAWDGVIDTALHQPAPASNWRSGQAFSVLISHPGGNALVQGSAGFVPGVLDELDVDVTFLSLAGIERLGRDYAAAYWHELVVAPGAERVLGIHFDDFTRPFGELQLFPDPVDRVVVTAGWLRAFAEQAGQPVDVSLPPLGRPVVLY